MVCPAPSPALGSEVWAGRDSAFLRFPGLCEVCARVHVCMCACMCARWCVHMCASFHCLGDCWGSSPCPVSPGWTGARLGQQQPGPPGRLAGHCSVPQAPEFLFLNLGTCGRGVHPSSESPLVFSCSFRQDVCLMKLLFYRN